MDATFEKSVLDFIDSAVLRRALRGIGIEDALHKLGGEPDGEETYAGGDELG